MAQRLRQDCTNMPHEHKLLTEALRRLATAAVEESKPDYAAFAEAIIKHAIELATEPIPSNSRHRQASQALTTGAQGDTAWTLSTTTSATKAAAMRVDG